MCEESAKLGDYPTLSIHANHINMCKFRDRQDGNCQKVVEVLERWAQELKEDTREVEIKETRVTPISSLQEAVTESDLRPGVSSRIPHSGATTKGINSE